MEYYNYDEWIEWPEEDIREYASEIADDHSLSEAQDRYLGRQMLMEAECWPSSTRSVQGPTKMGPEVEEMFRSLGNDDPEVFTLNVNFNRPFEPSTDDSVFRWQTVGGGLTRRQVREAMRESRFLRENRRRYSRHKSRRPFSLLRSEVCKLANDAMWAANCYPIADGEWLIRRGSDAPYEEFVWYSQELLRRYHNALRQSQLGNVEAALWHAHRAGSLQSELELRLVHGATFDKYEATSTAQRDAGRARKKVPDEVRREAYHRYRSEGHKRIEAGRLAAADLGLSEASIRNAFPGGAYPAE